MARPLTFTVFPHARATEGQARTATLEEWTAEFSSHVVLGHPDDQHSKEKLDAAKNHRAVVFGEIPAGQARRKENVTKVDALSIDIDKGTGDQILAAFKTLERFTYWAWTTHKSGAALFEGALRLRIVLPLGEPIMPADFDRAWAALYAMTGGVNDPQTKDICRLNYYPSTWDPTKAVTRTLFNRGMFLRLEDLEPFARAADEAKKTVGKPPTLEKVKRSLKVLDKTHEHKTAITALLEGRPFADSGGRHQAILDLTWTLASRFPDLDVPTVVELFKPSMMAMKAADSGAPDLSEVPAALKGALEKVREYRAEQREEKEQEEMKAATEAQLKRGAEEGQTGYTGEELEKIAARQGWPVKDLRNRWIIQLAGGGWVLSGSGMYWGPFTRDDLGVAATKLLARAPVKIMEANDKGTMRHRSIGDIVRDFGQVAMRSIVDMSAQLTTYDAKLGVMREAKTPLRPFEPTYCDGIDQWLRIMVGDSHYGAIIDWLSVLPDLRKMLCAIYFDGPPATGKTLFAHGAAKLWTTGGPCDIRALFNQWNDDLTRCPLVLADEEIPKKWGQESTTAVLRSQLSTVQRTLRRRYFPEAELHGAIRLVIAANNEFLLDSREVSTSQDVDAVAERFRYIKTRIAAAEFLTAVPREERERWAKEGIAQHILYLAKHHTVEKPGRRFYVEGDTTAMHRLLLTASRFNALVTEWLARYCMNPQPFQQGGTGLVRTIGGELLVNEQAVVDGWKSYIDTKVEAELPKVSAALRALSKGGKRSQQRAPGGKRYRYWHIDMENLWAFAERNGISDRATIFGVLDKADEHHVPREAGDDDEADELRGVGTVNSEKEPF